MMSFVETLDNLALKKSELVRRFERFIDLNRGWPDGNAGLCSDRQRWCGWAGRLSGNLQPWRLCRTARGRAEARFQFSPRLRRARLRSRISPPWHRRAFWFVSLAGRSRRAGGASGIFVQALLAGANHGELAAVASCRRWIPPALFDERSRVGAISLRVARHISASWHCPEHTRARVAPRFADLVRRDHDERGQPYRAWRVHSARQGTSAPHCARSNRGA